MSRRQLHPAPPAGLGRPSAEAEAEADAGKAAQRVHQHDDADQRAQVLPAMLARDSSEIDGSVAMKLAPMSTTRPSITNGVVGNGDGQTAGDVGGAGQRHPTAGQRGRQAAAFDHARHVHRHVNAAQAEAGGDDARGAEAGR
jgi:hypothetical protein